ncbi:50S ribosomal protein L6 [bacterium]|nr:50S ribosomal protein L6 [bacterium]
MSNVGKVPIKIPSGVNVIIEGQKVSVTGPKGTLSRVFSDTVSISKDDQNITVTQKNPAEGKNFFGLTRTLILNMVVGVTDGFEKNLKIVGVGYRAQVEGKDLILSLGFSHPVKIEALNGIEFNVEKNTLIKVSGIEKEKVGKIASEIRALKKPEPYKGKGIMFDDEKIRRKAGKSLKSGEGGK